MLGLRATEEEDDVIDTYLRRKAKCDALGLNITEVFPNSLRNGIAAQQPAEPDGDEGAEAVPSIVDLQAKEKLDAIGVAVRAGVLTPEQSLEQSVRQSLALPEMGSDVLSEWRDNPIRSPITLSSELAGGDPVTEPTPEDNPTEP
jgi:hypothetical protein